MRGLVYLLTAQAILILTQTSESVIRSQECFELAFGSAFVKDVLIQGQCYKFLSLKKKQKQSILVHHPCHYL